MRGLVSEIVEDHIGTLRNTILYIKCDNELSEGYYDFWITTWYKNGMIQLAGMLAQNMDDIHEILIYAL